MVGAFVAFHLLAMAGSMAIGTPPGDLVRKLTRPYERWMGVYQSWPMFSPNPPRSVEWLEIRGQTAAGEELVLPPLWGGVTPSTIAWRYSRRSKLERTLLMDNRRLGRKELLAAACAEHADLQRVWAVKVVERLPGPSRAGDPRAEPDERDLEKMRCPRTGR